MVNDGIKISGSWPWASGVDSAAWFILVGPDSSQGGSTDAVLGAWSRSADVNVDHDSWKSSGLQGTGSKTVADPRSDFCPEASRTANRRDLSGKVPGLEIPGNGQARFGYPTFGPTALVVADRRHGARRARCLHRDGARCPADGAAQVFGGADSTAHPEPDRSGRGARRCRTHVDGDQPAGGAGYRGRAGGKLEVELRVQIRRNQVCRTNLGGRGVRSLRQGGRHRRGRDAIAFNGSGAMPTSRRCTRASIGTRLSALYGTQQLGLQPQGIF